MILTKSEIRKRVHSGDIVIEPFDETQLNPNSYNYRLGQTIITVDPRISLGEYDVDQPETEIPVNGLELQPGSLYLASTKEIIGSKSFVTSLIGRSSVGRLGLFLQLTADLGHLGDAHRWTLELACVQPVVVYPDMLIGQVSFWRPMGEVTHYTGPYTQHSVPKGNLRRFLAGSRT